MLKTSRVYGLMVGITIGFAFWGSVKMGPPETVVREDSRPPRVLAKRESEEENMGIIPTAALGQNQVLNLHALSAVLMDGDTGRILYEKEGEVFRPMASTTKIMTCILALENGSPSDVCTVSKEAASQPKVHLGAGKGTQFYLKDLLYSLMLESHNDTAVMIAEQIGGSVDGFSQMMNQKARDLGCYNTCFLTPNGLDRTYTAPDGQEYTHGTTARELAALMRYCVRESPRRDEFLEITRTSNYTFTDVEGKHSFSCINHNALLSMMDGLMSGKTGFTGGAGYSYVAALEDDGRTYILALLGSGWPPHKAYKWEDARKLFDYGKTQFRFRDVYEEPDLARVPVADGIADEPGKEGVKPVTGLEEQERHLRLLLADEEKVEVRAELPESLEAPVKKGEMIGNIRYVLDGRTVRSYPLYAGNSVGKRDFYYCAGQIWKRFWPGREGEE